MNFQDLFHATHGDLLRFVERRVHPSHAEDVVADVWVVAWRRRSELPVDPGEARAWLFGVARRTLLTARRGDSRRAALGARIAEAPPSGDVSDAELVALRVDLERAWRRLSETHQEALALHCWDGLSAADAAAVLEISPVAYRLRLSRARRALRAHTSHAPAPVLPAAATEGNPS